MNKFPIASKAFYNTCTPQNDHKAPLTLCIRHQIFRAPSMRLFSGEWVEKHVPINWWTNLHKLIAPAFTYRLNRKAERTPPAANPAPIHAIIPS